LNTSRISHKRLRWMACLTACTALVTPLVSFAQDFSPDGKQVVVSWGQSLTLLNTDGTGAQPLPGGENGILARWAPDARNILFVTQSGDKYTLKLFNVARRTARAIGDNIKAPVAWREDGKWFAAVHVKPDGVNELLWYSVAENGITQRANLPSTANPVGSSMVWLPNTDDVALLGQDGNVYTVEAGEVHKVTTSNDVIGLGLARDGKHLVWARIGPNLKYILMSIYSYDLTARSVQRLVFPERVALLNPDPRHGPETLLYVTFAPDGTHLALIAIIKSQTIPKGPVNHFSCVYSIRMDGTAARLVSKSDRGELPERPTWSRDGRNLLVRSAFGGKPSIILSDADGNSVKTLLSGPAR
jgi:Tol biopolymer transport system component